MKYGVWHKTQHRWCNSSSYESDGYDTEQQAHDFIKRRGLTTWFDVRLISPDGNPSDMVEVATTSTSTVAVNDYVCPTCKNDRCSKSEKTCWKCGGTL